MIHSCCGGVFSLMLFGPQLLNKEYEYDGLCAIPRSVGWDFCVNYCATVRFCRSRLNEDSSSKGATPSYHSIDHSNTAYLINSRGRLHINRCIIYPHPWQRTVMQIFRSPPRPLRCVWNRCFTSATVALNSLAKTTAITMRPLTPEHVRIVSWNPRCIRLTKMSLQSV